MANAATHYRELAARAQAEADQATLGNVRDRALRSVAAFETMATQHELTAKQRAEREALASPTASTPVTDNRHNPELDQE
jgi:hypothetical protein